MYRALQFWLFLLGFGLAISGADPSPAKDRTVILITLDGFPAWIWADPNLPVPILRRLAAEGAQAKSMKVSNPSVTWINHTTLVTGVEPAQHGVLFNGLLLHQGPGKPPKIEPWAAKSRLVRVPTLYDLAHAAGLTTAQVDWVAITNSGTINWDFHEVPDPAGEIPRELVAKGILTQEQLANFSRSTNATIAWRDMVWTEAAVHMIKTRKPNFLLLHLLTTDSVNHRYGPGTLASVTAYAYVDRLVAQVLAAVKESGQQDRTTVLITTDHGFKNVTKLILPNVALKQAGLVHAAGPTVTGADAYVMTQGGMAFAYVTDRSRKLELLPKIKTLLSQLEGVERVLEPAEYAALGIPTPDRNEGAGDLLLYAKPEYAFQANAAGDKVVQESTVYLGTHGFQNTDPRLDGIFIAWGNGIRSGAQLDRINNLDVAPTAAELLGLKMINATGRVLREVLK